MNGLLLAAGAAAVVVIAPAATLGADGDLRTVDAIAGTATANPVAVVQAAADRKADAEAAAAAQKAADDAAFLSHLEDETHLSMQEYWDDPDNTIEGMHVTVIEVSLIKAGDTKYDGMARMRAGGGPARDIQIHVTCDGRTMMWNTDPGALIPLFR